jgi:hypothetical protein
MLPAFAQKDAGKMSRLLVPLALVLALCPVAALARQGQQPTAARLIDSFGDQLLLTDIHARLDNFAVELQNAPGMNGFIVIYGARHKFPGMLGRRAQTYLDYLVNTRGFGAARVSLVNGGLRDETTTEFWLAPHGAELPFKPFDLSTLMSGEKRPLPFDRIGVAKRVGPRDEVEEEVYPDALGLYNYLAEVLRADPGLSACVIGYTSRRGALAAGQRIAASAKMAIVKTQAVDVRRVVALGGGRREYKMVELWLVPPGAPMPVPTPTVRASRRKHR